MYTIHSDERMLKKYASSDSVLRNFAHTLHGTLDSFELLAKVMNQS